MLGEIPGGNEAMWVFWLCETKSTTEVMTKVWDNQRAANILFVRLASGLVGLAFTSSDLSLAPVRYDTEFSAGALQARSLISAPARSLVAIAPLCVQDSLNHYIDLLCQATHDFSTVVAADLCTDQHSELANLRQGPAQ